MEEIRNFEKDLKESNSEVLKKEWQIVLRKIFGENIAIDFKDNNTTAQLEFGTDIIIQTPKGRKYSVEVKTRRNDYLNYENWLLELFHHRYTDRTRKHRVNSKEGWLYCSTADLIVFGTLNKESTKILEVCAFSLTPFKYEEFKSEISKLRTVFAPPTILRNGMFQLTGNAVASKSFLEENADKFF